MYVKCVNLDMVSYSGKPDVTGLTLNKVYEVIKEESARYRIINDNGINRVYWKERFIIVDSMEENNASVLENIWAHHKC